MAKFIYKKIKHMTPREGVKYATDYYKQSVAEYSRLDKHIREACETVVNEAVKSNLLDELEQPLTGFPRTQRRPNYSALDIMRDMLEQINHERDIPSGMLGRWNRLFDGNAEFTIEMTEEALPNPVFNRLFFPG